MKLKQMAAVCALVLAGPAMAVTCYEIIDRTDTVVFRDSRPPVDMSAAGTAAREAMRARNS